MSSREFAEWMAYERLTGPIGPDRDDWRFAMVASVIANSQRNPKRRPREYRPEEFIPDWAESAGVPREKPSPAQVADKVRNYFQGLANKAKARQQ